MSACRMANYPFSPLDLMIPFNPELAEEDS